MVGVNLVVFSLSLQTERNGLEILNVHGDKE